MGLFFFWFRTKWTKIQEFRQTQNSFHSWASWQKGGILLKVLRKLVLVFLPTFSFSAKRFFLRTTQLDTLILSFERHLRKNKRINKWEKKLHFLLSAERKQKNKLSKKIQHAFEESIFWSQTKGICNRRGKGFFSSTLGETKELGTTKEQTKKERVCCFNWLLFFLFQDRKQRQTFFVFSFWSKLKKNKH